MLNRKGNQIMANRNYYSNASSFTNGNVLNMEAEQHEMKLRQMGGEVLQLRHSGPVCAEA